MTNDLTLQYIIKSEMKPSLGVTEPSAIALASATAYSKIGGNIKKIEITVDQGLFKNAVICSVPGSTEKGLKIAALLGALGGNPNAGLEVLKEIKETDDLKAKDMIAKNTVEIKVAKKPFLYVEVLVITDRGSCKAVIEDMHDRIVLIELNGKIVQEINERKKENILKDISNYKILDLVNFVQEISFEKIEFISDAIRMNKELAKEGLTGKWGMGAGLAMHDLMKKGVMTDDLINHAAYMVASSLDARTGGAPKPAMSIAGSGSHGCVATLPIVAISERKGIGLEKLIRAVALSFLITIYIKRYSGRLSAFCGCAVTAATAASAGIVFLLDGKIGQIEGSINNMAADVTGLLCDGTNYGCALKCATGTVSAVRSALFALEGITIPSNSGIVGSNIEETIKNIGKISCPGMKKTDDIVVNVISGRN